MREIKFRAWDKEIEQYDTFDFFIADNGILNAMVSDSFAFETEIEEVKPDRYVIEQYTGLKDKNGIEIYEGDIVKGEDNYNYCLSFNGTVGFKDGSFVIIGDMITHYRWMDYSVEIIGNIHD